ncbi:MAG: hypothetical protein H6943_08570 [Zoogloeaceae bacterium]|nr:hypothetical protein [Zoogloeaceae bacterium]
MHFPITIRVLPSRRLRAAFFIVHGLALAALIHVTQVPAIAVLGASVLLLSLRACFMATAAQTVTLSKDGMLLWTTLNGDAECLRVLPDSVSFSWLMVLRMQQENQTGQRSLIILSDSLSPQDYRRVQIWLRWLRPSTPGAETV